LRSDAVTVLLNLTNTQCRIIVSASELVVARKSGRRDAASLGYVADPVGNLRLRAGEGAARAVNPGQPLGHCERLGIGDATILVALQPNALAARHLRHFALLGLE